MTLTPTIEQEIETAANLLSNSYIAYFNNVSRFRSNFTIETFPHSGLLCSDCSKSDLQSCTPALGQKLSFASVRFRFLGLRCNSHVQF